MASPGPTIPSRTPARDRVRPFVAMALAEGWSVTRLAKEAGVGRATAASVLRQSSARSEQALASKIDGEANRAVAVARRIKDAQIATAERIQDLTEKALVDLEAKAKTGELSVRDLETLAKVRDKHWMTVKDLAGIALAERLHLAQAKGEAAGKGFAGALLDATAIELGDGVFEMVADSESVD